MTFITQGKVNVQYLLTIGLLAIIAGGGIWIYQSGWASSFLPPISLPVLPVGPPAGWKTYQNQQKGISFNYPESYQVEDGLATRGVRLRQIDPNWGSDGVFFSLGFSDYPYSTCCGATFDFYRETLPEVKKENVFLCGLKVIKLTYDHPVTEQAGADRKGRSILFYTDKNESMYYISFSQEVSTESIAAFIVRDTKEELDHFSGEIEKIVNSLHCEGL